MGVWLVIRALPPSRNRIDAFKTNPVGVFMLGAFQTRLEERLFRQVEEFLGC